jgi:hypothetical protein
LAIGTLALGQRAALGQSGDAHAHMPELGVAKLPVVPAMDQPLVEPEVRRSANGVLSADCFFDPSTALCLKNATEPGRSAPLVALREPTRCPNACITGRHRPVWARAAEDARILLREKRLSELQRVALRRDLDRIEAVLDGITTPASADPPPRFS